MNAQTTSVIAAIRERRSPRFFTAEAVGHAQLTTLFEAARWAASSYNEQPWRFIVAQRDQPAFAMLADCLVPQNAWAMAAPVLMLSICRDTFAKSGKPNRHAWHDVGLAMGTLSIQAAAMGLQIHQMAGFDPERARTSFAIPDGFQAVAMAAIGHPGDPAQAPEPLRRSETAPRERQPLNSMVFSNGFGQAAEWAAD